MTLDELSDAVRNKRSVVIPLGKDDGNEEELARQHAIIQTIVCACGLQDRVASVFDAGYVVRSRTKDGAVQASAILISADPEIVGWIEQLFGLRSSRIDGWDAEVFKGLTHFTEITSVSLIEKLSGQMNGICDAVMLAGRCGNIEDYLLECHKDEIPSGLLALLNPTSDDPAMNSFRIVIDPSNPRRVTAALDEPGAPMLFDREFPARIKYISSSDGHYYATDILGFKWKIPLARNKNPSARRCK